MPDDTALTAAAPSANGAAPRAGPFSEIGTTGLKRFGGYVYEEFDPVLRGLRGVRIYEEMRNNDPDVGALLFALVQVALAAEWHTESASDEQQDLEAEEFLKSVLFEDMSHSWMDFLIDSFTDFTYGWAMFELVFKQRLGADRDPASLYDDGRIGIRKIAIRGQESLDRWEFDQAGGIAGMWQRQTNGPSVLLPIEKCLLVRTTKEKNNPEGRSLLRNAYKPYYFKKNLEEIEVIGAERDMTGVPVIRLPANATEEDRDKARDMGERFRVDDQTYFLMQRFGAQPHEQWDIELLKTPGSKVVDTDKSIMRYSVQIARSVLAQFLTLGQGRVGSYALSKSQQDLFHLAVKGLLDIKEELFNRFIVTKLFALNDFTDLTALPRLKHSDLGDIDLDQLGRYLNVIGTLGLLQPTPDVTQYLHQRGGLPYSEDYASVDERPAPAEGEVPESAPVPATMREWGRFYLR